METCFPQQVPTQLQLRLASGQDVILPDNTLTLLPGYTANIFASFFFFSSLKDYKMHCDSR